MNWSIPSNYVFRYPLLLIMVALSVLFPANGASSGQAPTDPPFNLSQARKSVVFIKRLTPGLAPAVGSGFLVSNDGLIYTNRHVIRPAQDIVKGTVILVGVPSAKDPDMLDYFQAEVVYCADPNKLDFGVLKIAATPGYGTFKALPVSFAKLELGSNVAVIGYPHVKDDTPVLAFNKGSISATRVSFDDRTYYQTDAAVNPGNSGGPLLNSRGEAVGIITMKKTEADNLGYALYLNETKEAAAAANALSTEIKAKPGPLDPMHVPVFPVIKARASEWEVATARVRENRESLSLDNDGGQYWIVTKSALPENFQIVIPCRIEFLQGRQRIQPSQRSILRTLCVRFGTEDTKADIMERKGYLVQFTQEVLHLWKDDQHVKTERRANTSKAFTLTVAKQHGEITVSVDDEIVLSHRDAQPLKGAHKLCVGGYLSRLELGAVTVIDLKQDKASP